ncbi:MAG: T9SS type A sorting domain-containing protein [Crocinitomicaceae bacterium]|nr:T9SS type A sorting domain-containing protein [Crocinitomicaceae bacterium]
MKNIYSTLIFIIIGFASRAQGYVPFPDSGAVWVNSFSTFIQTPFPHCELTEVTNYCMYGEDTTINLMTYHKIMNCSVGSNDYKGAIRDNGFGQVYFVPRDSSSESLLMDFEVNVTDTIYDVYFENFWGVPYITDIEVIQIDTVIMWGVERKRISYDNGTYGPGTWIQGIGNEIGLFLETADIFDVCIELECMTLNDTILWPSEGLGTCQLDLGIDLIDFDLELIPNPSSDGVFKIQYYTTIDDLSYKIYTPNGQVVQEGKMETDLIDLGSESGIYFIQLSNGQGILTRRIIVQ